MRVLPWIMCCLALAAASCAVAQGAANLLECGDLEGDVAAWTRYGGEDGFVVDATRAHSGQRSARVTNPGEELRGLTQEVLLEQEFAGPIVVGGWSSAEGVTGSKATTYSLWCDIEYMTDTRPGRVDAGLNLPFSPGTHDWEHVERTFVPDAPIKRVRFYALFRWRPGTVWFDDLYLKPVSASGNPQLQTALPDEVQARVRELGPDELIVSVRQGRTQEYHQDPLVFYVNGEEEFRGEPGELSTHVGAVGMQFVSRSEGAELAAPYAAVRLTRVWGRERIAIETQGLQGASVQYQLVLPAGRTVGRLEVEEWEADFDGFELSEFEGRTVVSVLTETMKGRDRCVIELSKPEVRPAESPQRRRREGEALALETGDGLRLEMGLDGAIAGLQIGGEEFRDARVDAPELRGLARDSGLFVGDFDLGEYRHVAGALQREEGAIVQRAVLDDWGLKVEARYSAGENHIAVEGFVEDTRGEERRVDVVLKLPVVLTGWRWWHDINRHEQIVPTQSNEMTVYTFSAATSVEENAGLGLAIAPTHPCVFTAGYDPLEGLLHLRAKYGLSPEVHGTLKGRATFSFLVYRVDERWGFRDAARKYYVGFPDLFTRRAHKEGSWLFACPSAKLPNPRDYGYHEGGPRGMEDDHRLGILTIPYIMAVQKALFPLPEMPADYEAAMQALADFGQDDQNPGKLALAERIASSAIRDETDMCRIVIRDDVGADIKPPTPRPMVVFCVNVDPNLYAGEDTHTAAKWALERAETLLRDYPDIDGIYIDGGSSAWGGRYPNYRRDHFPWVTIPLSYDERNAKLFIDGRFSVYSFFSTLREMLHERGKVLFPNLSGGTRPIFDYFLCDVPGMENGRLDEQSLSFYRTASYHKPTLMLNYLAKMHRPTQYATREGMTAYFVGCARFGLYPAIGRLGPEAYEQFSDLYDSYMPVIRAISHAGWEPVTHVSAAPQVRLERFGPAEGRLFVSVYNGGDERVETRLTLDTDALQVAAISSARGLLGGTTLAPRDIALSLDPGQLEVVELEVETAGQ